MEVRLGSQTATLTLRTNLSPSWMALIMQAKHQLLRGTLLSSISTISSSLRLRLGRFQWLPKSLVRCFTHRHHFLAYLSASWKFPGGGEYAPNCSNLVFPGHIPFSFKPVTVQLQHFYLDFLVSHFKQRILQLSLCSNKVCGLVASHLTYWASSAY